MKDSLLLIGKNRSYELRLAPVFIRATCYLLICIQPDKNNKHCNQMENHLTAFCGLRRDVCVFIVTNFHFTGSVNAGIGGAGRSSEVERSLMVRWVVGSILHGVDPLSYFSFQPVLHDWCNKSRGMCYPVSGMLHIKEPLLLIDKSSLCGGSGFPFSLSEWSLTVDKCVECVVK